MNEPVDPSENPDATPVSGRKSVAAADIFQTLREMILSFELYPGSRVTETELAEHFGVSRTPIREALLRLEHEGHLSIRSKQGCFIRDIDIVELSEYYRVRVALEMAAVEAACSHMSTSEVERLVAFWNPATRPEQISSSAMEESDESFHLALAIGGGNAVLVKYLRDINDHIRVIRRVDFNEPDRIKRTYQEHYEIAQCILNRETTKARNLIKRHIHRSEEFAKTLTLTQLARKKSLANRFGRT
jgi:DNA-binding GntR family transcriptional regulator